MLMIAKPKAGLTGAAGEARPYWIFELYSLDPVPRLVISYLMLKPVKLPISALPLPPVSQILTRNLTPDPFEPNPAVFSEILRSKPSIQRRSRLLDPAAHFSYVCPLPIAFPYRVSIPEGELDQAGHIEKWLAAREATEERPSSQFLKIFASPERNEVRNLLGISPSCVRDCFPSLDIGDSISHIRTPSLLPNLSPSATTATEDQNPARQELIDVLSGHATLASFAPETNDSVNCPKGYAPWALRYSGHQFGVWAGQLGDGRAISILETPHPTQSVNYELQLKGAGRTPFSRTADGLAVVRSSIREYLCAEAMHALSIPTTRSLCLISLPQLPVRREKVEHAAVLTRVAPSFIRIGSFEALNPPETRFFFGGGQQKADYEALRILGEWVAKQVLKLNVEEGEAWGEKLVMECARRNARMVACWQAYGFMHGVLNTDNISILGLTIDYGPFAFMDIYNHGHICNHSDGEGRYAFKYQPTMIIYALRALLNSLSPLIGAEAQLGHAVAAGWATDASESKLATWAKKGKELQETMEKEITETFEADYWILMRKRLGLRAQKASDPDTIIQPLLDILENHGLDFHSTFRALADFDPALLQHSEELQAFIFRLVPESSYCSAQDREVVAKDWLAWLGRYAKRIDTEKSEWDETNTSREQEAKLANPRFILRQWVLEEVIAKVEKDHESGRRILAKILEMASRPFDPWGSEGDPTPDEQLPAEQREERRLCGLGSQEMLGFQCSCSS